MPKIKYNCALNEIGDIINIADVVKEDCKTQRFLCINCGAEMIPKLGQVKARHFAHKADVPDCNPETYLHKLAKLRLKEKFYSSEPFEIAYWQLVKCSNESSCPFFREDECKEKKLKSFDLKKRYDTCQEEQHVGGFVADLKISSSRNPKLPPIIIEIYISHKCTILKKESGLRIIEVRIKEESDIQDLIYNPIMEDEDCQYFSESRNAKCRFYGFKKNAKLPEPLDARNIPRFYLFKNGSAFVSNIDEKHSCQYCSKKDNPKAVLELNIDTYYLDYPTPYEIGYVTALNLGFNVKTCQVCKFRKDGFYSSYGSSANFCCLYKKYGTPQYPDSKYAMSCQYYKLNNDLLKEIQQCLPSVAISVAK